MRQQARWQVAGIRLPISINISAQQMMAPFFVDAMVALLAEHHRDPQQIELGSDRINAARPRHRRQPHA